MHRLRSFKCWEHAIHNWNFHYKSKFSKEEKQQKKIVGLAFGAFQNVYCCIIDLLAVHFECVNKKKKKKNAILSAQRSVVFSLEMKPTVREYGKVDWNGFLPLQDESSMKSESLVYTALEDLDFIGETEEGAEK